MIFLIKHTPGVGTKKNVHFRARMCTDCAPMCTNVHKCALMCTDVHKCAQMCTKCARMCTLCTKCAPIFWNVHICDKMCTCVHLCALMCTDVRVMCTFVHRMCTNVHHVHFVPTPGCKLCVHIDFITFLKFVCTELQIKFQSKGTRSFICEKKSEYTHVPCSCLTQIKELFSSSLTFL